MDRDLLAALHGRHRVAQVRPGEAEVQREGPLELGRRRLGVSGPEEEVGQIHRDGRRERIERRRPPEVLPGLGEPPGLGEDVPPPVPRRRVRRVELQGPPQRGQRPLPVGLERPGQPQ